MSISSQHVGFVPLVLITALVSSAVVGVGVGAFFVGDFQDQPWGSSRLLISTVHPSAALAPASPSFRHFLLLSVSVFTKPQG